MNSWEKAAVYPTTTILETIEAIDKSTMQIAIVIDENKKLLGTVTDGDIRRGILRNVPLHDPVERVMNASPKYASIHESPGTITSLLKNARLKHLPIVDEEMRVIDVKKLEDILKLEKRDNPVVLMAGGLGTRLRPLTEHSPKPLLKVGEKPILQTILESFIDHRFSNFYISVNYKAEMIKDYFGDGSEWGVSIRYIDETQRMGTAGALSLLPEPPMEPLIVMNGDLLTKVNFENLLDFHNEHHSFATMCVREYNYQVPYGIVRSNGHALEAIEEKPVHQYFINAGIYVLAPSALEMIPRNQFYDMPDLFKALIGQNKTTSVFPIREYWMDIGRMSDFERANMEYTHYF
ncbi:nucleotidyltransferase family protein [Paenibacillus sp.]|uniref:nucleotidyltransferase family protein n=1 Tax=Paenibacillus sp. TaxID=58172 RepID=UPI002D5F7615|nr:nucleotidyltransferase family protein [Paenibacillus sp.]HZG87403.1 nucleotidyltransferase family protein [Paenibacillus sp.]